MVREAFRSHHLAARANAIESGNAEAGASGHLCESFCDNPCGDLTGDISHECGACSADWECSPGSSGFPTVIGQRVSRTVRSAPGVCATDDTEGASESTATTVSSCRASGASDDREDDEATAADPKGGFYHESNESPGPVRCGGGLMLRLHLASRGGCIHFALLVLSFYSHCMCASRAQADAGVTVRRTLPRRV